MIMNGQRSMNAWDNPQSRPHIEIRNLVKTFGDEYAIDNISLNIYKGEFFSLLGPSGCGKSTLLRMLAGFETPTSGEILLEGEDMSKTPPYRRPVNMMFQSYALFPHMTVEGNIAFGLKQDRVKPAEISKRVAEALELVQMGEFAKRRPRQLSGGQRQRVALARSIVKRPKLLLLDEPLGALDKRLREQTQFELMTIQEELGITFMIVTHDQEEAMTVSSRIGVMGRGTIEQVATPTEIYESPNSRYVADFIGDINIFQGKISAMDDHTTTIHSPLSEHPFVTKQIDERQLGKDAWVAVRPEKIDISLTSPSDKSNNLLKGIVWDIGYLGNLTIYHVKLTNEQIVIVAELNDTRIIEQPIDYDETVYLTFAHRDAILLTA